MEPTREQIKEFWEWYGLQVRVVDYGTDSWVEWQDPDDIFISRSTPDIDLNNLFKYAVPRVSYCELFKPGRPDNYGYWFAYVSTSTEGKVGKASQIKDKDPALALFWALREVLLGGDK